jgi:hypothetical protein
MQDRGIPIQIRQAAQRGSLTERALYERVFPSVFRGVGETMAIFPDLQTIRQARKILARYLPAGAAFFASPPRDHGCTVLMVTGANISNEVRRRAGLL